MFCSTVSADSFSTDHGDDDATFIRGHTHSSSYQSSTLYWWRFILFWHFYRWTCLVVVHSVATKIRSGDAQHDDDNKPTPCRLLFCPELLPNLSRQLRNHSSSTLKVAS
jgi:hypothetical protein